MQDKNLFYDDKIVIKPWGHEYVVYRDRNKLCVTLLKINYNHKTSLHCHPKKKSGFILLKGNALFQLGLWKKRSEIHKSPSKRMISRGLFHSIKSVSKSGLIALEFETPVDKKDLVRLKDSYGRKDKSYEGKEYTKNLDKNFIKFKKPSYNQKQIFNFGKVSVSLELHKNFKKILKNKPKTIFGILGGSIIDPNGREVLSSGDIIRTNDFKVFSKVFKIKKTLSIVRIVK